MYKRSSKYIQNVTRAAPGTFRTFRTKKKSTRGAFMMSLEKKNVRNWESAYRSAPTLLIRPIGTKECGGCWSRKISNILKGTVARDFYHCFFHKLTPYGPLIHILKYFRIRFRIRGDIRIRR
jgi:hypothetical protein